MEHSVASRPRSEHDSDPPSVAFSNSSARLHERTAGLAIATALLAGVLGCLALLGSSKTSAGAAAQPCTDSDLDTFRAGCEQGDAVACNNLGVTYQHGYSVTPDEQAAFRAFELACAGGSADGCSNLGALYERGEGSAPDLDQAARLYELACNAGAALGCSNLGALRAQGRGVAPDAVEARRLFQLACETGSAAGCTNWMATDER